MPGLKSLKRIDTQKAKIKTLHNFDDGFEEDAAAAALPDLPDPLTGTAFADLLTGEDQELLNALNGDEWLMERVKKLQSEYPQGSLPELLVKDWLQQRMIPHTYQVHLFGGRMIRGGAVPDFVLTRGGRAIVLRINGNYWHTKPGAKESDLVQKLQLLGAEVNGMRVESVVDVWEEDLLRFRDKVMNLALAGVGLRG